MKFLKKVFLILALPILVPNSYAMENGQNGKKNKIIIQCESDQQFIIAYDNADEKNDFVQALNKSETFKHMMEDIPLKDGSTLIIAPVTKKRFEDHIWPYICEIDKNTANKNIEAKNLNLKTMCNLIKDANYLDIEPLLDICCDILAKKLCSDEGLAKFEKRKLIPSQCFPAETNKKIAKVMFENYVKDDVKAIINKKLAKKLDHNGQVLAVCFSQDGTHALTGSRDKTAKIWNVVTGKCLRILNHPDPVPAVCFSQDGKLALTGCWDHTAKIWNVETGECLRILNHNDAVFAVCFSQDGTRALTGSRDVAKIWNVETGECLRILNHNSAVFAVCFSQDGTRALTGSYDHTAKIWKVKTGECLHTLDYAGLVSAMCFSQDGTRALTGSYDHTAKIWNAKTGECLHTLNHNDYVEAVCFSQDGTRALTGAWDHTAKIWNAKTGECLHTLNHNGNVSSVCFSQDGKFVLTGSWDHTAKIWNLNWHKDLTCEQMQLLLLYYNKQPINSEHLNTIAATLPENLQEIIKHQSSGLKKYLIAGAAVTGIAGLYLLWNYLQK